MHIFWGVESEIESYLLYVKNYKHIEMKFELVQLSLISSCGFPISRRVCGRVKMSFLIRIIEDLNRALRPLHSEACHFLESLAPWEGQKLISRKSSLLNRTCDLFQYNHISNNTACWMSVSILLMLTFWQPVLSVMIGIHQIQWCHYLVSTKNLSTSIEK